jgi:hypothetical protein
MLSLSRANFGPEAGPALSPNAAVSSSLIGTVILRHEPTVRTARAA